MTQRPLEQSPGTFADRRAAGRALAERLIEYADREDVVVLGLPRGGVPVAYEVAQALRVPLDVLLVRKLGVPGHEELAFGAIASGGVRVLNEDVMSHAHLSSAEVEQITAQQRLELDRRELLYRDGRPPPVLRGLTAIIVDDGLATGATMLAAVESVRQRGASPVVAIPVAAPQTSARLASCADALICIIAPSRFTAVGIWYRDFAPTRDGEVRELLTRSGRR